MLLALVLLGWRSPEMALLQAPCVDHCFSRIPPSPSTFPFRGSPAQVTPGMASDREFDPFGSARMPSHRMLVLLRSLRCCLDTPKCAEMTSRALNSGARDHRSILSLKRLLASPCCLWYDEGLTLPAWKHTGIKMMSPNHTAENLRTMSSISSSSKGFGKTACTMVLRKRCPSFDRHAADMRMTVFWFCR